MVAIDTDLTLGVERPTEQQDGRDGIASRLVQLGSDASKRFAARVFELALSPADASVVRLVAYAPGLSQREVADRLGLQPSRLGSLVDALEVRALIKRTRSVSDRRLYELRLTPDGRALYARLAAVIDAHERDVASALSPYERRQLMALLDRLLTAVDT